MENHDEFSFKNAFFGKAGWFLIISALLLLVSFFLNKKFLHDLNDQKAVTAHFEKVVHEKEKELELLLDQLMDQEEANDMSALDSTFGDHLYQEKGIVVFSSQKDSLVYWSDNTIPYNYAWGLQDQPGEFLRLKNGWYVMKSKRAGPKSAAGIILIKKDYPYQNLYLENAFQDDFEIHAGNIDLKKEGPNEIHSLNGDYLFSLEIKETANITESQALLLFIISSLALLFVLSSLYAVYNNIPFFNKRKALFLVAFIADVIILRLIFRVLEIPEFLYESKLFSPYYFATSWMEPSLGDLWINRMIWLVVANVVLLKFRFNYRQFSLQSRYALHFLQMLAVAVLYFYLFKSFKAFVEDSSLLLNLNDISGIDKYSFIGFIAMTASILAYFLFSAALLRNIWNNREKTSEFTTVALVAVLLMMIASNTIALLPCHWPICLIFLIYLLSFQYFLGKRDTIYQLPAMVLFMILFAISSTYMLNHYNASKEVQNRKIIASSLTSKRDPMLEFEFLKIRELILKDSSVLNYFDAGYPEDSSEEDIKAYLEEKYFTSFWKRYKILVTTCNTKEVLDIQPDNYLIGCFDFFDDLIAQKGVPTNVDNLYYIDNQRENNNYIAVFRPSDSLGNPLEKRIYVELYYKFITETGLGYPELLIDKELNVESRITDYSYARYVDDKLIYVYGDYFYHLDFDYYTKNGEDNYYLDKEGYNHYVVSNGPGSWLIISRKNPSFFDVVAPFSYLFLFFSIFLIVFITILYLSGGYRKIEMNFRNRFQFAIITIIIFSLIVLGLITRAYIIDLNNKKNVGYLTEKTYSVLVELEHKLGSYDRIDPAMEEYIAIQLDKFASVFFSDINLYYLDGDLIASSRPQIFEESLLSKKMNRKAFSQLTYEKSLLYIHNEQIGKQEYLSAYIPFRNIDDQIIAYLNLPYFAKQDEMREEIADFISAYINIYVLLIVLAILITILVSRYVTQPLKLIREKMRNLSYNKINEKIVWNRDDEIGELVAEYNRTLDELAKSAELLARSERESAWREMAKQVAHEIKNPLTPMKLSVQYLKKAWDEKSPGWEERLDRFTKTIIEQIESLSRIASEFSDFAKMPMANYEKIGLLETIHSSVDLFRDIENIEIIVNSDQGEYFISADRQQMLRVFNNLVNNSVQAIGKKENGRIEIAVSKGRNVFEVTITDNGSGISEEQAEKIFSPSFTTKSSGMGLGLAMVKNILSGIGATISFTSEEGVGTTFILEIPAMD